MIPDLRIYNGNSIFQQQFPTSGGSTVTSGVAERIQLDVNDGLFQGDRKNPNPFFFGKTRTYAQRWYRFRRFSDQGGGPRWDMINSDIDGANWDVTSVGGLYSFRFNTAALEDQALKHIFDQMRYGHGNLVVDLAEARQTIQMIRNAGSVRKIAKQFIRELAVPKNYSSSRRLKYATDKWLEYRYGWLPFISSTYELLKTLSRKVDSKTIVAVTGRASFVDKIVLNNNPVSQFGGRVVDTNTVEQSFRVQIKARMRARSTLEIYDFTSLNPFGIAWELVPLSFVADWFTNVGDTLSLWEDYILFANRFVNGFETRTYKEDICRFRNETVSYPAPLWPNGQQVTGYLTDATETITARRSRRSLHRFLLQSLPSPGGFRIDVNLNSKRLLDAASLIRGVFGNPKLK
jgi:hypothetical protein